MTSNVTMLGQSVIYLAEKSLVTNVRWRSSMAMDYNFVKASIFLSASSSLPLLTPSYRVCLSQVMRIFCLGWYWFSLLRHNLQTALPLHFRKGFVSSTLFSPLPGWDLYLQHYQLCQVGIYHGLDNKARPWKSLKKQTKAALDPKPHIWQFCRVWHFMSW